MTFFRLRVQLWLTAVQWGDVVKNSVGYVLSVGMMLCAEAGELTSRIALFIGVISLQMRRCFRILLS